MYKLYVTLNFTEKEIKDLLSGRRALSDKDVSMCYDLEHYNAETTYQTLKKILQ